MAGDGTRFGNRQICFHQRRQLTGDVVVHVIVSRPRFLGGIHVEPRALTEIVAFRYVRHVRAARAGIGNDQGQPQFRRVTLRPGLDPKIVVGAGQAG